MKFKYDKDPENKIYKVSGKRSLVAIISAILPTFLFGMNIITNNYDTLIEKITKNYLKKEKETRYMIEIYKGQQNYKNQDSPIFTIKSKISNIQPIDVINYFYRRKRKKEEFKEYETSPTIFLKE